MALDQVIAFHRVSRHLYELSGLRTGSIRDQILRGTLLAESLVAEHLIGVGRPLAVIGAGAAGVATALAALERGVDVVICDKQTDPFGTQQRVRTRRLDPCEYDWPHPHWRDGRMSPRWAADQYPLRYTRGTAEALARRWRAQLKDRLAAPKPGDGGFEYVQKAVLPSDVVERVGLNVTIDGLVDEDDEPIEFAAVVSCVGFSGEKTVVPAERGLYVGPLFWANDRFETLGHSSARRPPFEVLVSGGGDGAQQDIQRILTGSFGMRLFDALGMASLALPLEQVLLTEDRARRAHAWQRRQSPPDAAYQAWHDAYERLAHWVIDAWQRDGVLRQRMEVLRPGIELTWLLPTTYVGFSYGLNRLVTLVLTQLHALAVGRPWRRAVEDTGGTASTANAVVVTGAHLVAVNGPDGHVCGPGCDNRKHDTFLNLSTGGAKVFWKTFDLVIARHGIDSKPFFAGGAPVPEQVVPMHRPA